jgi:hypothetical protein
VLPRIIDQRRCKCYQWSRRRDRYHLLRPYVIIQDIKKPEFNNYFMMHIAFFRRTICRTKQRLVLKIDSENY